MKQIYYAIQNIIRGKDSTLIKVVSLSLGLFLSIILFALVGTELSYDSFYQDNEDIYVVETAWDYGDRKTQSSPYNIYPTGETLMKHFPEHVESPPSSFLGQVMNTNMVQRTISFQVSRPTLCSSRQWGYLS